MEHLIHLGGRLLGKKSVAITFLGLLGLCCPLSLSAEKLDTTFVLDMVVDTTPCYYVKYNNWEGVIEQGRYTPSDYFRINIGYVTNEKGEIIDTLIYACDKVTKQWREISLQYFYNDEIEYFCKETPPDSFYTNGMLRYKNYVDYNDREYVETKDGENIVEFSQDGYFVMNDVFYVEVVSYPEWHSFQSARKYDEYGNITYCISENTHGTFYKDDYSTDVTKHHYSNIYDDKGNLVSVIDTVYEDGNRILRVDNIQHYYDESNRRTKSVYDGYSLLYTYGQPFRVGEPILLSLRLRGEQIDGFSSDSFYYDLSDNPGYYVLDYTKDISYVVASGASVKEISYDSDMRKLTITVEGSDSTDASNNVNTYTVTFSKAESYLTSLNGENMPVHEFSYDKYEYDFSDSDSFMVQDIRYEHSRGAKVEQTYKSDSLSSTMLLTVYGADYDVDSSNVHTYSITGKKPESFLTSMTIDGVSIEEFSSDKYEYDFMDTVFSCWDINYQSSLFSTIKKSYDTITNTLSIFVYGYDYKLDSSNVHVYSILCERPESYLTSLSINGEPVIGFSSDKFKYDFSDSINYMEGVTVDYTTSTGAHATEHFLDMYTMAIDVKDKLSLTEHRYTIEFGIDACLTSLSINGQPVDDFSPYKFEYDFSDSLEYDFSNVSYTWQDVDLGEDVIIDVKKDFDDKTGILTIYIEILQEYHSMYGHDYTIKFKKPKPESFLTSMELDGTPIDTFSVDKYIYDLSDYSFSAVEYNAIRNTEYLKGVSDASGSSYDIRLSKPNDSNDGINFSTLKWSESKYSTFDVSYEEETGVVAITVKGADYEEDSSNFHVYKILTSKIDSLSIDSFQVDYTRGGWSNNVNVIAGEHEYKAFSSLPADFSYDQTGFTWSASSIIDVTMDIQYSEEAHTIYYIFSHKTIQSLVDTYYVVLQPCVISIYTDDNSAYEAVDKFEHNIVGEYK
ncbi:MAG: hypothetical protein J5554_08045, partial [Paludibacteraceae bacterium]|nr:hypothetical protein [Paludibacteraceae bacterium]